MIAYNAAAMSFEWFIHPDIPVNAMCGMLELVKVAILSSQMARQQAAQQVQVLGPDGRPMPR